MVSGAGFNFLVKRKGAEVGAIVFFADSEWVVFGDVEGAGFIRAKWEELEFAGFVVERSPFEQFMRAEGGH